MASSFIISWQINEETIETMTDFIFLVSKIMADGDCNHEMKTLASWKKSYDKPRQCIKSRDITLLTTVLIVKAIDSLIAQMVKNLPAMQETWV